MEPTNEKVPVKEGLFTWPSSDPQLIAARCSQCGHHTFPYQQMCPECCDPTMEEAYLNKKGKLFSFTGMHNPPPDFKATVPYTVGILEFPEGIKIIGLTTEKTTERLKVGMEMEVVIETIYREDDKEYVTYKFKPVF